MKITQFEDMEIWKDAIHLSTLIYQTTNRWEFKKNFWLRDQIRRAANSVSSNIVEGFERQNNNEFIRFLKIAKWSCGEVRNQIYIAFNVWYIEQSNFETFKNTSLILSKKLSWFIKYLENNRQQWNFTTK
ncbi:MAG: S23 ribosomal protein [uncultured bacterium (gcode 4)]|uniref:S23 ribosomal protein n=1 Tax=uncultured bacterium (gcode 4) TaxID=1234023 RepID=K1X570_9BACT|nr:MAG: S23 ribosomal protein [uncultured bacterium (gcode 4)]